MANTGFGAPKNFWGLTDGLSAKTSNDGATVSTAEALDEYGDARYRDTFGNVKNPTVEYAVRSEVDLSGISLGTVVSRGTGAELRKYMITQVVVRTSAGELPAISVSGVQVEASATTRRTYALLGTVTPRARAQDVAGALASGQAASCRSITTTFKIDSHVQTVAGDPVFSDGGNGAVEVSVEMTDPTGEFEFTVASGWTMTVAQAENAADAEYITKTATATKSLTGAEPVAATLMGAGPVAATLTGGNSDAATQTGDDPGAATQTGDDDQR